VNVISTARDWLANDPHEETQHQLRMLIEQAGKADPQALGELLDSFNGTLQFGTAGLRGKLGPGPNRMNLVVVARAAAGLAQYLLDQKIDSPSVVIGFDARHNSELFANVSAQIFSGYGITAKLFPHPTPTPVVAFAIRHLHASAGVVVTASHNPPEDNGYKVYLGSGSQIIPPADIEISECIARATASGPVRELPHGTQWELIGPEVEAAYVKRTSRIAHAVAGSDFVTVYTAMHGVGGRLFLDIVKAAGFPAPVSVAQQFEPNAAFPTVTFPNPEEPGAIDLAVETAKAHKADLIIANDPDADRCAVAIPTNSDKSTWRMLHGDEVGSLLAAHIAQKGAKGVFAQSIVSSTQLEVIARLYGFEYQQTLTGFKWIGPIPHLVFGYEEALGYCVDPEFVKDKDGLSAAVMVMELASALKLSGKTLQDELDRIAIEVGVFATDQVSVRVSELSRIPEIMEQLRSDPPTHVAGAAVTNFIDLAQGTDQLPPTDGLLFNLEGGGRIIVRPSGTEPKVKVYLQSVIAVPDADQLAKSRVQAATQISAMAEVARTWLV
jgi:phosphomannomutase